MDANGGTDVDLTEAAGLMKQSSTSSTVTNPTQMQPPPLMMMQQAVAMQQFQFQQALLMQQVMATQQAAARAATVKSAAEMAAARAAEISKQLKGGDVEEQVEEKKPSPSRSKSRSLSRSRSVSRSKSRSPIRYRRDRSLSRSPVRYRRDRPYSPSRSRDYYGYRRRSRRGYFRGRGDYMWNPYRRDLDRDRDWDHNYSRNRRSRSRSRNRGWRRSRSRSRSPRYRRERTPSPRYKREDRRLPRTSRRSRSRDTKRSESSRSRSLSHSPGVIEKSISPPPKNRRRGGVSPNRRSSSLSPAPRIGLKGAKDLNLSPAREDEVVSPDSQERGSLSEKEEKFETESLKEDELSGKEASATPPRSLSVSLHRSPTRKESESEDEIDLSSKPRKASSGPSRAETSADDDEQRLKRFSPPEIKPKMSSSDVSSDDLNGNNQLNGKLAKTQTMSIKGGEKNPTRLKVTTYEESEEDEELDDWRDDVKSLSKEEIARKAGRRDHESKIRDERRPSEKGVSSVLDHNRLDAGRGQLDTRRATSVRGRPKYDPIIERKSRSNDGGRELRLQDSLRYRGSGALAESEDGSDHKETGKRRALRNEDMDEDSDGAAAYQSREDVQIDLQSGSKAPLPAAVDSQILEATVRPVLVEDYKDTDSDDGKVAPGARARPMGGSDLEDDVKAPRGRSDSDDEEFRKTKEKRSRDRRLDDEDERQRRKERHKRHKKKHRRDDNEEEDDSDSRREKRRHKRRHKKEEDERRDRKKRKHKSRKSHAKSVSESAEESPRGDVYAGRADDDASPVRKKSSSRHRKRRREPSKSPANSGSSTD